MTKKKIYLLGGSAANPVTPAHVLLNLKLQQSEQFDWIIWRPCGRRPDKGELAEAIERATETSLAFPSFMKNGSMKTRFDVDYTDIHLPEARKTMDVIESWEEGCPDAEIWWYTGADSVVPQEKYWNKSEIQATWYRGEELWKNKKFIVLPRDGYTHPAKLSLPSNFRVFDYMPPGHSSTMIREAMKEGRDWKAIYRGYESEGLDFEDLILYLDRFHSYS